MGSVQITRFTQVDSFVGVRAPDCTGSFVGMMGGQASPPCTTDAAFVDGIINQELIYTWQDGSSSSILGSVTFGFDLGTAIFALDGDPPISYNSLPSGILFTSLPLDFSIGAGAGSPTANMKANLYVDGVLVATQVANGTLTVNYDLCSGGPLSPNDLITIQIKFEFSDVTAATDFPTPQGFAFSNNGTVVTTGIYTLAAFQWTLETPTDPIEEDSQVTVTSPVDPDAIDFSQLLTATLDWTDEDGNPHSIDIPQILWITFTIHLFLFRVPTLTGNPPIVILNITSTQFSGSVTLGRLITIFFLNATGIYTLTSGKRNDTLYDNDNGGTIDVKFPNPSFKTGFVGG